jgi:BMFP domain-containing protein YqiC
MAGRAREENEALQKRIAALEATLAVGATAASAGSGPGRS